MKRLLIALAVPSLTAAAYADTVNITSQTQFITPSGSPSATTSMAFTPRAPIVFRVAGKTCHWASSWGTGDGAGIGAGNICEYSITVDPDGNLVDASSQGLGCTPSGQPMVSACN